MPRKAPRPAAAPSREEKSRKKTSRYRGVSFTPRLSKWKSVCDGSACGLTSARPAGDHREGAAGGFGARSWLIWPQHFLGYHDSEAEAAHAYDDASVMLRGSKRVCGRLRTRD